MEYQEFTMKFNEYEIFCGHRNTQNTKGVVVLVHGMGEHSARYFTELIPNLNTFGLAVVFYDNIGHGKSSGKRGHCPSYEALLDLLHNVITKAKGLYSNTPLFLYGHSMGGNLVLNYALKRANIIDGIIATSPYLRLAFQPPKWKMSLGKLFLKVLPSITLPSGLDPSGISRIEEEVTKYKNDPLVHDKVSPMFSFPVIAVGAWAISNATTLIVPTLLIHGTGDLIIDYRGTEEFHKNAEQTELILFEGGYHELHNDLCKTELFNKIQQWFKRQL